VQHAPPRWRGERRAPDLLRPEHVAHGEDGYAEDVAVDADRHEARFLVAAGPRVDEILFPGHAAAPWLRVCEIASSRLMRSSLATWRSKPVSGAGPRRTALAGGARPTSGMPFHGWLRRTSLANSAPLMP